jgi:hypothetical protein
MNEASSFPGAVQTPFAARKWNAITAHPSWRDPRRERLFLSSLGFGAGAETGPKGPVSGGIATGSARQAPAQSPDPKQRH